MPSGDVTIHAESNFDDTVACLTALPERMCDAMREGLHDGTEIIFSQAVANIPKRTGRTAGTIDYTVSEGACGGEGYVGTDDEIAAYLEYGTDPHPIAGAPVLSFEGIVVREVDHPGTSEYAWLLRAGEESIGPVEAAFVAHLEAAFRC